MDNAEPSCPSLSQGFGTVALEDSSWQNAHSVCEESATLAAPFTPEELCITPCSMDILEDKATLQTLSQHVKHLTLYTDLLPPLRFEDWEAKVESKQFTCEMWPSRETKGRYAHYAELHERQLTYIKKFDSDGGEDYALLAFTLLEALQSLPKLEKITVGDCQRYQDVPLSAPHQVSRWFDVWRDLNHLNLGSGTLEQGTWSHLLTDSVLQILPMSNTHILKLDLGVLPMSYFDGLGTEGGFQQQVIADSVKDIMSMNLELVYEGNLSRFRAQELAIALGQFLLAATGLRNLGLSVRDPGGDPTAPFASFVDVLEHIPLTTPILKKLRLSNTHVTKESLMMLLLKYQQSLRSLELESLTTWDDKADSWRQGWPGVFQLIATTLKLRHISLLSLYQTPHNGSGTFFCRTPSHTSFGPNNTALEEAIKKGILEGQDIEEPCEKLSSRQLGVPQ